MKRTAAEIEQDEKRRPRSYDLSDPAERERLLRETVGYAMVGLKYGTDTEGRRYAYEALNRAFCLGFRLTLPDRPESDQERGSA
jgi:hypothetical protein